MSPDDSRLLLTTYWPTRWSGRHVPAFEYPLMTSSVQAARVGHLGQVIQQKDSEIASLNEQIRYISQLVPSPGDMHVALLSSWRPEYNVYVNVMLRE